MNILYGVAPQNSLYSDDEVYAGRLAASLWVLGCRGELANLETNDFVCSIFGRQPCHIFHAFHAGKAGGKAISHATNCRIPLVVTCTGPDLLISLSSAAQREQIWDALSTADHIILPFSALKGPLHEFFPPMGKITVIPKGVHSRRASRKLDRKQLGIAKEDEIVLLIGDIEPIKNQMFALTNLKPIHEEFPNVRVVLLGDVLDEKYGHRVTEFCKQNSWVTVLPMQSRENLPAWYKEASIVLNVSHVEGGYQPFLEAMAAGVPAIAAEIPGNWSFIRSEDSHPGQGTGLIFSSVPSTDGFWRIHDSDEFQLCLVKLLSNVELRKALGNRSTLYMRSHHRPQLEAYVHLKLYESILEKR